jgi:hypothetical protein
MQAVKQKTQAFAAFLGVCGLLRDVIGGCCIHNTILACPAMRGGCVTAQKRSP